MMIGSNRVASNAPPSLAGTSADHLARYLQRRGFSLDSPASEVSLPHFALRSLVLGPETSTNDTVRFAASSAEPMQVEQQYSKFKVWISESPDVYKPELAQLLYPMFTHLYLELVCSGQKQIAQKFHKRHQSTFLGNAEFASFIRQLSPVLTPADVASNTAVRRFAACKYSVTLSNRTFHFLMRYLQSCGPPSILLHVLRGKVDLKLADALGASSKAEAMKRMEQDKSTLPDSKDARVLDSARLHLLRQTLSGLSTSPPLPSTCLYRLRHPAGVNFTCAAVSGASILAAGAESSAVHVWGLLPGLINGSTKRQGSQRILLGYDRLQSDSDDNYESSNGGGIGGGDHRRLIGHSEPVYCVAFVGGVNSDVQPLSANQLPHLLSAGGDCTMRIWDLRDTGCARAVYRGHTYPIWAMDVDRLGIYTVTGSMDRTARLWHPEYTFPVRVYAGHERDVDSVGFHPNCNYLATGSVDRTVRMWSHADAKMVRVLSGHRGAILALSFSPDGRMLASAGEDRRVRIWDLAQSAIIKEFKGHNDAVHALAWSMDSALLSSAGLDGTVRHWDVKGSGGGSGVGAGTGVVVGGGGGGNSGNSGNSGSTGSGGGGGGESNSVEASSGEPPSGCSSEMLSCHSTGCDAGVRTLAYTGANALVAVGVVGATTAPVNGSTS